MTICGSERKIPCQLLKILRCAIGDQMGWLTNLRRFYRDGYIELSFSRSDSREASIHNCSIMTDVEDLQMSTDISIAFE